MTQKAEIVLNARNRTKRAFMAAERDARRAAENIRKPFAGLEGTIGKAGLAITAFGMAGGALIASSAMLAARVETLGVVVEQVGRVAGYAKDEMHGFVDSVVKQGITVQAARTAVVKLTQANIDLSHASKLARIAQDAAVIAGINSSEAFERMIHGITTLNPLILRKLGIMVNLEGEYTKVAKASGRASSELSGLEKQMIATSAVMAAGEKITGVYEAAMGTAGKAITSLPRHLETARVAIGEVFLPAVSAAVSGLTDLLKAFNAMPDSTKAFAGYMLGAGVAVASTVGPILFMMSKLPGLASSLVLVGSKIKILARAQSIFTAGAAPASAAIGGMSAGLAALATAAIAALAIIAVTIAIAKLVQFAVKLKERMDEVNDTIDIQKQHMLETAGSYDEYRAEMERVGQVTKRWVGTQEEMNDEIEEMKKQGLHAAQGMGRFRNAIIIAADSEFRRTQILLKMNVAQEETDRRVRDHIPAVVELADANELMVLAQERAAEKAKILREMYQGLIDELNFLAGIDFGKDVLAHSETIEDLNVTLGDLQDELKDLEGSWKAAYPSGQEEIAVLQEKIESVNEAIDRETTAWEENTAQLIFNMAQRALSVLPIEDQFLALGALAEELGLVDEGTADMWERMGALTSALATGAISADTYAKALAGIPTDVATDIVTNYSTTGTAPGGLPPHVQAAIGSLPPPPAGERGERELQHGGLVAKGAQVIAAERGLPELFVPDSAGRIYSNAELQRAGGARAPDEPVASGEAVALLKGILAALKDSETVQINITEGQDETDLDELARQILTLIKFRKAA